MRLRLATMDDALDVLAWRNDPVAIAMSKTPGATDQKTHMAWFARAIRDEARVLLIALNRDEKVGLVRFDRTGDAWLVSINIAPEQRGKGYGRRALTDAIALLRAEVGTCRILAEINVENARSLRLFESLGFVHQQETAGFHTLVLRHFRVS